MSFLGRFEKKVEGAVSGAFARAFKGDVQPVEIAARLQRELDGEAKLVSRDRRLVPNDFAVQLSPHDHEKLVGYTHSLTAELITDLRKHAAERGYLFNGPVTIRFSIDPKLPVGRFTVTSQAVAGPEPSTPPPEPEEASGPPTRTWPEPAPSSPPRTPPSGSAPSSRAALVLEVNGARHPLLPPGMTIGRGTDADLRINDPGVSRLHAEIRVSGTGSGQRVELIDLGSTNGVLVDGQKVQHSALRDGSRIQVGSTRMLVHDPSGN